MADAVVAVTGGVASGKSEATRAFEALGIVVADADVAARAVVEPGEPALAAVAARFGPGVLLAALGAWCGAWAILPIVLMSSLIGAVVGSLWLWLRGADRATPIPFGPYLAAAGWLQLLYGERILQAYKAVFGLG